MKFEIFSINIIASDQTAQNDFWIKVHVDISEPNSKGAETIRVDVISSERLKSICSSESVLGRGKIFMDEYDEAELRTIIYRIITKIGTNRWENLYLELGRYFDFV